MDIESLEHCKVRYDVLNELDLIELHQVNIHSNVLALDQLRYHLSVLLHLSSTVAAAVPFVSEFLY